MRVTAKDLRFNISMLFYVLSKGKVKAKLIAYNQSSNEEKRDKIFGMWQDRE